MLAALVGNITILENTRQWQCVSFLPPLRNNPDRLDGIHGVIHCGQWQRVDALTACGLDRTDIVKSDMVFALRALSASSGYKSYYDLPCHSVIAKKKP